MLNPGDVRFFKYVAFDVVGYSTRSAESMAAIVAAINEIVPGVLQEEQLTEEEWLFSTAGDAVFIALHSRDDFDLHIRIALKLLRHVKARNETVAESERFQVRIGIYQNTDNVVLDLNGRPTIAGEGINLTERVMSLADGSQILLGDVVHAELRSRDQYRDKLVQFENVGIKHGSIDVWQYVDRSMPELNCDVPTKILSHQSPISLESSDRPLEPDQLPGKVELTDLPPVRETSGASEGDRDKTQIAHAVKALSDSLISTTQNTPDEIQLIRVQLITTAFLAKSLPTSMLGVHESNRLYRSRDSVELTVPELISMLRSLITDDSGFVPGWYWLKEIAALAVEKILLNFAITDPYSYARHSAFYLLANSAIPIGEDHQQAIEAAVKGDSAPEVRQAALRYVGRVGDESCRSIIGARLLDRDSTVVRQAKQSQYLFLARIAPNESVRGLVTESVLDIEEILAKLSLRVTEVSEENLVKAIGSVNAKLRLFGVKELASRGRLTVEQAEALVNDEDADVKTEAYRFLVAQRAVDFDEIRFKLPDAYVRHFSRAMLSHGEPVADSRREIVLSHYREFNYEQLTEQLDWQQLSGSEAYLALAMNFFDRFGDRVRADLEADFSEETRSYYEKELPEWERMTAARGTTATQPVFSLLGWKAPKERTPAEQAQSTADSRKEDYLIAALAGVIRNGRADDVKFARRLAGTSNEELRLEVVKLLRRFGDATDVGLLLPIAKSSSGLAQEDAANAALELAEQKYAVADELINTHDELLLSIAIAYLTRSLANAETVKFLLPFLGNGDEKIRTRVIAYFIHNCSGEVLAKVLTEYLSTGTYYYDVVCSFDRAIYAPEQIAAAYRALVDQRLFGLLDA